MLPPLSPFLVRSLDSTSSDFRPEFRHPKRCQECRQENERRRHVARLSGGVATDAKSPRVGWSKTPRDGLTVPTEPFSVKRSRVRRSRRNPKLQTKAVDVGTSEPVPEEIVRATLALVADDDVLPVETLPATVGVDASSELLLAASRLDSLSSAVGLDPFRSMSVDVLLTSFLSMPTEQLDYLAGVMQELRHEFEPEELQRASAPLVNLEGVLLAALYARLPEPSLQRFDDEHFGSDGICGPLDLLSFFSDCYDYQDGGGLEGWLQKLRAYQASGLVEALTVTAVECQGMAELRVD